MHHYLLGPSLSLPVMLTSGCSQSGIQAKVWGPEKRLGTEKGPPNVMQTGQPVA